MWITGNTGGAVPIGARVGWNGDRPVWLVDAADGSWRMVSDGAGCRLLVVGACYATDAQLRGGLPLAGREEWRALTVWPGSYWIVADNGRASAVISDVAGSRPVYFTRWKGSTVWASAAGPLAELTGASLDLISLVARMTCPTVAEVTGTDTAFTGVYRVPGGHLLLIEPDRQARVVRYEPNDTRASVAQAADALRSALLTATAVRTHAAGRVSADFSGGLDSTTLALLASRTREVLAVTRDDPAARSDDISYAERAGRLPGIRHLVVGEAEHALFFDRLLDAPRTDQPFSDAARWSMRYAHHRPVIEQGTDVHLTGSGGDTLLSASAASLADLVTAGSKTDFLRHASARARLRQLPVSRVVADAVRLSRIGGRRALLDLAEQIEYPARRWSRARSARLRWYSPAGLVAWLPQEVRRVLAERARYAAETPEVERLSVSQARAWDELREFGAYQAELTAQLEATGVPAHAPMMDNAVVRACMSIPVARRWAVTAQKPLLAVAMNGLVPEWLLLRPTKGAYDGNAYAGLRRNASALRSLLRGSVLANHGPLDLDRAIEELARVTAGAPGRIASLEALLTTELWLQTLTRTHGRWTAEMSAHV